MMIDVFNMQQQLHQNESQKKKKITSKKSFKYQTVYK